MPGGGIALVSSAQLATQVNRSFRMPFLHAHSQETQLFAARMPLVESFRDSRRYLQSMRVTVATVRVEKPRRERLVKV